MRRILLLAVLLLACGMFLGAKRDNGCGMCQHAATYGCYTGAYIPCLESGNTQQFCYKVLACCEYDYGAENCQPCTWVSVADEQCNGGGLK